MKYLLSVFVVLAMTACNDFDNRGKIVKKIPLTYDLPPNAPIPPERFCFEQNGKQGITTIALNIEGDSVFGQIDYPKAAHLQAANFLGVIYGQTLVVNYKMTKENRDLLIEQEWKMHEDSLYKSNEKMIKDSIWGDIALPAEIALNSVFTKVPCKK